MTKDQLETRLAEATKLLVECEDVLRRMNYAVFSEKLRKFLESS